MMIATSLLGGAVQRLVPNRCIRRIMHQRCNDAMHDTMPGTKALFQLV